ncbi:hypothetical protein TNCV_4890651 [Trichonephila clavipes]|nr:hypothetical protein TNCV_4890651 [Trichonephila clavipes]
MYFYTFLQTGPLRGQFKTDVPPTKEQRIRTYDRCNCSAGILHFHVYDSTAIMDGGDLPATLSTESHRGRLIQV